LLHLLQNKFKFESVLFPKMEFFRFFCIDYKANSNLNPFCFRKWSFGDASQTMTIWGQTVLRSSFRVHELGSILWNSNWTVFCKIL
jgi:hypothetical protein